MWNLASRYVAATAVLVSAAAAVAVNQRSGEESAMTLKPEVVGKDRLLRTKRHAFSTLTSRQLVWFFVVRYVLRWSNDKGRQLSRRNARSEF